MISRENPVGISATEQITVNVAPKIKELHEQIRNAEQDRSGWLDNKRKLLAQRLGIRTPKTVPWVGASNDNWPLTDAVIRRWKPGIMALILDADPVAYFMPTRPETIEPAKSAQPFFHWEFHHIENLRKAAMRLTDLVAQHGLAYTHEGWSFHIQRSCRVVRADSLFPGGVEASLEQVNAQITQANAQLEEQQTAGQAPSDATPQPLMDPASFVRATLVAEYNLDEQVEAAELNKAVMAILQGAKYVKIYYHEVIRDSLAWEVLDPRDVIVPTRTTNPELGEFVAIAYRLTRNEIFNYVRDGLFLPEAASSVVEKLDSRSKDSVHTVSDPFEAAFGNRSNAVSELDAIEGVESRHDRGSSPVETFWKVYTRLDIDGNQIDESVVLWYHPASSTVMSLHEYVMPFEEWPVTPYYFEYRDQRPYSSRGAAELLSVFQKTVNKLHNARIDSIQIILSPAFTMRASGGDLPRNLKFRPGLIIPIQAQGDFQPVQHDMRQLVQFLQEESFTKSLAEQYVGVFDASVLQQGAPERRTATEVEAITSQISNVSTADAVLFQDSFARSLRKLWKLWKEFGPEETYFRVVGEEQPRLVRKVDIAHDFDIEPAGTPANTNRALALARAREALSIFAPDQTGLINKHELYKWYFDLTDRNMSKLVVRPPEDAAAVQMLLQIVSEGLAAQGQKGQVPAF